MKYAFKNQAGESMKHDFSSVSAEMLFAAIEAITMTPRSVIGKRLDQFTINRHVERDEWIVEVGRRTYSSPEYSHAIYSALSGHPQALAAFERATGWRKQDTPELKEFAAAYNARQKKVLNAE